MAENTLGEKLRQAREERGLSLSEVADQTRISSLYLESIENDDYRILPGGIFNKGFVKSYAKYVGLNEQEALQDYAQLVAEMQGPAGEDVKTYRPEVLTDDRTSGSMAPTIITALIILGLMTGGILFLIDYLRRPADETAANLAVNVNTNTAPEITVNPNADTSLTLPEMGTARIEFTATSEPVSLTALADGKSSANVVQAGSTVTFEPKESLKLRYSRSLAQFVELKINGKTIIPPAAPQNPRRNVIEIEINRENLARIWTTGSVVGDLPTSETNTNVNAAPVETPAPAEPTLSPPISSTPATVSTPVRTPVRVPATPRPANSSPPTTPANRTVPRPSLRPTVITVPSANRPG